MQATMPVPYAYVMAVATLAFCGMCAILLIRTVGSFDK